MKVADLIAELRSECCEWSQCKEMRGRVAEQMEIMYRTLINLRDIACEQDADIIDAAIGE